MALTYVSFKKIDWRGYASILCEALCDDPPITSDVVRDAFTSNPIDPAPPIPGHTHATAAAMRTSVTNWARKVASHVGVDLYIVGMSKSDQRKGLRGSRQWYWAKDTNADNRLDKPGADDIEYICDVDYYLDMPDILSRRAKPTLLYSVVPETASSTGTNESSTRFDADGALETLVAGGGSYRHHLWDYAADSIIVSRKKWGVTIKVITYAVERKQVGPNRQAILLAPIREFNGISAWLADWLLDGKRLKRFDPVVKTTDGTRFIRFMVHRDEGTFITTGRPSSQLCATVTAELDEAIATSARLGTTKLMLPTAQSWIDDKMAAAVLTEFHRVAQPKPLPIVYPVRVAVRAYQYEPHNYDAEAKPKLQAFMSPLVHAAYAPVPNGAGERRCVEGRINGLRKEEPKPHSFRDQCITEFAELVVRGVHLGPVCYETVADKQTSAAQKLSLARACVNGPYLKRILKCFIKAESYTGVKDPRNISTYNDADKLEMAQYALALSAHLKQFSWYGPGMTPVEIADRVAIICSKARYVNISDYHRMDGTISYVLRHVDRAVCMKAFTNDRVTLNELLKRNVDNKGILPHGTRFDQGSSHGSGCSATSVFQTLRAAFTAYLAFRHTPHHDGRKRTPTEAFASLGCHLGDDGIDAELPAAAHKWAAERVGLVLEANIVQRGERGVNFLARYYSPQVWYGCNNSMCDAKRQLSKFHTTVRLPDNILPEQKLVEKSMSFLATDANTPVIGELCQRVLLLSTYRPKSTLGIGTWWSKFDESVQYPNTNVGGWMDVEFAIMLPEFDRCLFSEWLEGTRTAGELLAPPLCHPTKRTPPAVVAVVVDEEVYQAQSSNGQCSSEEEITCTTPETSENSKERNAHENTPQPKVKVNTGKGRKSAKRATIKCPLAPVRK